MLVLGLWSLLDTYLFGTFRWMSRKDRALTWNQIRDEHDTRWAARYDRVKGLFGNVVLGEYWPGPSAVDEAVADVVVTEVPGEHKAEEGDIVVPVHVQHDLDNLEAKVAEIDGVTPEGDVIAVDDTFSLFDALPIMNTMANQMADGTIGSSTEFDFSPYKNHKELLEALEYMVNDVNTKEELAYWTGRVAMLRQYMSNPKRLINAQATWALIWHQYQSRQGEYPRQYMQAGVMDMAEELRKQKAPAKKATQR